MTDPIAFAVAFSGNLKAKIINMHRKYSRYLISLKYEFQSSGPVSHQYFFSE